MPLVDDKLPSLTPIKADWIKKLIKTPSVLKSLIDQYESPINIHNSSVFIQNYEQFHRCLENYGLEHQIFFARKANKCKKLVEKACQANISVDTASYRELKQCIDLRCDPSKLILTAAIKSKKLINLAIDKEVLIILDNEDECILVEEIASAKNKKAKIGFRVSGFEYKGEKLYSRFGFDIDDVFSFLINSVGENKKYQSLDYHGIHFHLNGYSTLQRAAAISSCITLSDQLKNEGFHTRFIDIGGGFLMNYLEQKEEWETFHQLLLEAQRNEIKPITFQNNGLGYQLINEEIEGKLQSYPYFNECSKTNFLKNILDVKPNGRQKTIAQELQTRSIKLQMEPGRSLLDQVGITIARVAFRKLDQNNDWLIGLEMNMTQMHSSSADFLLDPEVIYLNDTPETKEVEVYFTGAYCLERDLLLKRKIRLEKLPQVGDLVVFFNTAGYMMHFFESEAHLFELATNLFVNNSSNDYTTSDFVVD